MFVVLAVAIGELLARTRGAAAASGRAPPGPPPLSAPARTPVRGVANGALVTVAVAVAAAAAIFGLLGLFGTFGTLASNACSARAAAVANRCDMQILTGWLVLVTSQLLLVTTALAGALAARSPGQLARAALAGVAGQVVAFAVFVAAASPALHG